MAILKKYSHDTDKSKMMVVVVDEAKKTMLVTTQAGCEKNNLTPFDFTK